MVLYIAGYLVRRQDEVARSFWGFAKPMLLLVVTSSLILMQPDFGTTVVLFATALGMLFIGGVVLHQFAVLIGVAGVAGWALIYFSPYRWQRMTTFLNPWDDPFNTDFQLSQALIPPQQNCPLSTLFSNCNKSRNLFSLRRIEVPLSIHYLDLINIPKKINLYYKS